MFLTCASRLNHAELQLKSCELIIMLTFYLSCFVSVHVGLPVCGLI